MKSDEQQKLERIDELLNQMQKNFVSTYKEIHGILESIIVERELQDEELNFDEDEEFDEELVKHIEEIFGDEE